MRKDLKKNYWGLDVEKLIGNAAAKLLIALYRWLPGLTSSTS
jgi:hypothetical protein